jgi:magnesium transporter
MIRSLVISPNTEIPNDDNPSNTSSNRNTLRRNLSQENLEQCLPENCIMWLDVVDPTEKEIKWLETWLHLSPVVVSDLSREDRRPTLLVYPEYLFLSLFQPRTQGKKLISQEIHCIIGEHYCVTVRQSESTAIDEAYNRVVQNPDSWERGVAYFLYLTSQHIVDTYYPLLDRISIQLNDLEEKLLTSSDDKQAQKALYNIKQNLIGLRQMIAPQREVVSNLIGEQRVSGNSDTRDLFRHLYERLLGIYDVIDSQRDLTNNVLEIINNQQSRKMGEAVNRLTIISMVVLPFTFFLGFFDSNIFAIGETVTLPVNGLVFSILLTGLMLMTIAVMRSIFQKQGWF